MNRHDRRRVRGLQQDREALPPDQDDATVQQAVIAAVDFLFERGATNIVIEEQADGSLMVHGNTIGLPDETTTLTIGDVVVTIGPAP